MAMSTSPRTKTLPKARRTVVALGLVSALSGGMLVSQAAQAPQASAATTTRAVSLAAKPAPRVALAVTNKVIVKGKKTAVIKTRATRGGAAVQGWARLLVNGDAVRVKKLYRGNAVFRPATSHYDIGKNRVRVVIVPSKASGLARKASATRYVRVKPAGSPVVNVANRYVGARYVAGGSSPSGFDCSGFTSYVYRKAIGKSLPRTSSGQKSAGRVVSRANARPGDIIWTPGHVAIYIGNGKQIEAARPGVGVVKRAIWQDNPRFVRVSNAAIGA